MSWWRRTKEKLFGSTRNLLSTLEVSAFPHCEELHEALKLHIFLHEIRPKCEAVSAWSFLSEGYWEHEHPEILLTLLVPDGHDVHEVPDGFFHLFAQIYDFATQGYLAEPGSFTGWRMPILGYQGFAYVAPDGGQGIPLEAPTVTAIPLRPNELEILQRFGAARLFTQLGELERYFPTPFWADLARPALDLRFMEDSFLDKMLCVSCRASSYVLRDGMLEFRPGEEAFEELFAQVGPEHPLALLTAMDSAADSCFTWLPGVEGPYAISIGQEGNATSGCYLAFVPEQERLEVRQIEDGLVVMLSTESWRQLRKALVERQELLLPPEDADGFGLHLAWPCEDWVNPIDGAVVNVPGGWNVYRMKESSKVASVDVPAECTQIVLLTSDYEMGRLLDMDELTDFIRCVEGEVKAVMEDLADRSGHDLVLELTLLPAGEKTFALAYKPEMETRSILDQVLKQIEALDAPWLEDGSVSFQMYLAVWGGDPATREYQH